MTGAPRPTARQRSARAAVKKLGVPRVEAFLRALRESRDGCLAVKLINEALDRGDRVEDVLLNGDQYGYSLRARPLAPQRFEIDFGCCPGGLLGDGGTWVVEFNAAGRVLNVDGVISWIS